MNQLMARLAPERRVAFALTQLNGLTYAEVAVMTSSSAGTVASRVARARNDLIAMLEPSLERGQIESDRKRR